MVDPHRLAAIALLLAAVPTAGCLGGLGDASGVVVTSQPLPDAFQVLGEEDELAAVPINTDALGSWAIRAGGEVLSSGEGQPPTVSTHELAPGEHTVEGEVDGLSASTTVTVTGADPGDDEANASEPESDEETTPDEQGEPAGSADEPADDDSGDLAEGTEDVPVAVLSVMVALLAAAGVRPRA